MTTTRTPHDATTLISAARGLTPLRLGELWAFRELAGFFLWRDLKSRYKQMLLGPIWIMLQPLLNMIIFTIIFSYIAKLDSGNVPYPLYNYSSLLLWGFFSKCMLTTSGSLKQYKGLISKIYFPRFIVPVVGVMSALVDFVISLLILFGMMAYFDYTPTVTVLYLPFYLLLASIIGVSVGLWLAPCVVHFWDVQNITSFAVRAWMYATPIVYHISVIPEQWLFVYRLNPMVNIIEGYRWSLLGEGIAPDRFLALSMIPPILLLIAGAYVYRRAERNIVDIA